MNNVLEKDRVDEIEVDGDRYVVSYEENTIPGKADARIVEYTDRFLLDTNNDSLGTIEVLEGEVAQNPEKAIEYLETNYDANSQDSDLEELISFER